VNKPKLDSDLRPKTIPVQSPIEDKKLSIIQMEYDNGEVPIFFII